uniref:Uncharacterized protein n=1 Tax=Anguilla anguilla TaxID=7936 RepID=A0A0E9VE07_ANGAN
MRFHVCGCNDISSFKLFVYCSIRSHIHCIPTLLT